MFCGEVIFLCVPLPKIAENPNSSFFQGNRNMSTQLLWQPLGCLNTIQTVLLCHFCELFSGAAFFT